MTFDKCTGCGSDIDPELLYCPHCGKRVETTSDGPPTPTTPIPAIHVGDDGKMLPGGQPNTQLNRMTAQEVSGAGLHQMTSVSANQFAGAGQPVEAQPSPWPPQGVANPAVAVATQQPDYSAHQFADAGPPPTPQPIVPVQRYAEPGLPEAPHPTAPPRALARLANTYAPCLSYGEAEIPRKAVKPAALLSLCTIAQGALLAIRSPAVRSAFDWRTLPIPIAIVCAYWWGNRIIALRAARRKAIEPGADSSIADSIREAVDHAADPGSLEMQLGHATTAGGTTVLAHSPLVRHVQSLARQWKTGTTGIQDADVVVQQEIAQDDERLHAGYQLTRTLVWAMPVLGLIGTVIGISLATNGFATFLKGNVDDVGAIKTSLVGVTSGLSFAFLITLLGLLGALLLMFQSSFCQAREERMYAGVHASVANTLLPAIQRKWPLTTAPGISPQADIQSTLERMAAAVGAQIASSIETAMQWSADKQKETMNQIRDTAIEQTKALTETHTALNSLTSTTSEVLAAQQAAVSAAGGLAAAISDAGRVSGELCNATRTVVDAQAQLQEAIQQLHNAGLTPALADLSASLSRLEPVLSSLSRPFVLRPMDIIGAD